MSRWYLGAVVRVLEARLEVEPEAPVVLHLCARPKDVIVSPMTRIDDPEA